MIDLAKAVDAVRMASRYGLVHSREAFASYLGHQTAESGPFRQKLAALRDFGLIDSGSEIRVTPLGSRLAMPESADDESRDKKAAFFEADAFAELHANSAKGIALDEDRLAASGVHNLGISPTNRKQFAESFISSAVFAGVASRSPSGGVVLENADLLPMEEQPAHSVEALPVNDGVRLRAEPRSQSFQTDFVISHPLGDGEVTFRLQMERSLAAALFADLQEVAAAIERLAAAAMLPRDKDAGESRSTSD